MIDIQGELLALQRQREEEYISIAELLSFLKTGNPNSYYGEIATYLLIKLEKNDIRKTDDELWGYDAFEQWEEEHGIRTFEINIKAIDEKPKPIFKTGYFFEILEKIRDEGALIVEMFNNCLVDYAEKINCHHVFIKREQIENLLNIKTLDKEKLTEKYRKKQINSVAMALTKTEEFVKNTDINKSPVGTAERLVLEETIRQQAEQIAQLTAENESLKANQAEGKREQITRISQAQKAIFTLLTLKNYSKCATRNDLFNMINADLKLLGIITKDISYQTLDKMIDEEIRLGNPPKSPFPTKLKPNH